MTFFVNQKELKLQGQKVDLVLQAIFVGLTSAVTHKGAPPGKELIGLHMGADQKVLGTTKGWETDIFPHGKGCAWSFGGQEC